MPSCVLHNTHAAPVRRDGLLHWSFVGRMQYHDGFRSALGESLNFIYQTPVTLDLVNVMRIVLDPGTHFRSYIRVTACGEIFATGETMRDIFTVDERKLSAAASWDQSPPLTCIVCHTTLDSLHVPAYDAWRSFIAVQR
jgi:hypothetical protein